MNAVQKTEGALLFDLSKPTLHALSYALRHPDTWPKGFTWYYGRCTQCAMGLAHELWKESVGSMSDEGDEGIRQSLSETARVFGMPYEDVKHIFSDGAWRHTTKSPGFLGLFQLKKPVGLDRVTPEMVADDIDAYLTKVE